MGPIIFSGPSGIGKNFLIKYIIDRFPDCEKFVSTTTRDIREGEIDGFDYNFVTEQEFESRKSDMLLSMTFNGKQYGIEKEAIDKIIRAGKTPIGDLHLSYMPVLKDVYPNSRRVYLRPSRQELLIERMQLRGDSPLQITQRLAIAQQEILEYRKFYYNGFNHRFVVRDDNISHIIDGLRPYLGMEKDFRELPPISRA